MGRPPLGIISTTVRLPKTVLDRIDVLLGPNRRAEFIRQAVESELSRREEGGAEPPTAPVQAEPEQAEPKPKLAQGRAKPQPKAPPTRGIVSGLSLPAGAKLRDPTRK